MGDAELDEGAVWEALMDPMVSGLGELVWIVDLNRQSLDRVVPANDAKRLQGMFEAVGWQVLTVKYGGLLTGLFERPGGDALRQRIESMSNPEYQRLLRCDADTLRLRLPGTDPDASRVAALIADIDDSTLLAAVRNLGGHDMSALMEAFDEIDDARPTVVFAYTVKGHGLASEGHPQNHSSLLTETQLQALAERVGVSIDDPWRTFEPTPRPVSCVRRWRRGCTATQSPTSRRQSFRRTWAGLRPVGPPRRQPWAARCSTSRARRPRRRGAS